MNLLSKLKEDISKIFEWIELLFDRFNNHDIKIKDLDKRLKKVEK